MLLVDHIFSITMISVSNYFCHDKPGLGSRLVFAYAYVCVCVREREREREIEDEGDFSKVNKRVPVNWIAYANTLTIVLIRIFQPCMCVCVSVSMCVSMCVCVSLYV